MAFADVPPHIVTALVDAVLVAPKPPVPTTLLVASCGHHANHILEQFGAKNRSNVAGDYRVVFPGQALAGFRADLILVTAEARRSRAGSTHNRYDEWWDADLPRRLSKDGKIVNL